MKNHLLLLDIQKKDPQTYMNKLHSVYKHHEVLHLRLLSTILLMTVKEHKKLKVKIQQPRQLK